MHPAARQACPRTGPTKRPLSQRERQPAAARSARRSELGRTSHQSRVRHRDFLLRAMEAHRIAERHGRGHSLVHTQRKVVREPARSRRNGVQRRALGGVGNKRPRRRHGPAGQTYGAGLTPLASCERRADFSLRCYAPFTVARWLGAIPRNLFADSCGSSPNCDRRLSRQQHEAFGVTRS